jgi:hypothetical protein
MGDFSVRAESHSLSDGSTNWSAVWSGLFTFVGIWSVFELLDSQFFPEPLLVQKWDWAFGPSSSLRSRCSLLDDKQVHLFG